MGLPSEVEIVSVNRVDRLMREDGIVGKPVWRLNRSIDSDHN